MCAWISTHDMPNAMCCPRIIRRYHDTYLGTYSTTFTASICPDLPDSSDRSRWVWAVKQWSNMSSMIRGMSCRGSCGITDSFCQRRHANQPDYPFDIPCFVYMPSSLAECQKRYIGMGAEISSITVTPGASLSQVVLSKVSCRAGEESGSLRSQRYRM